MERVPPKILLIEDSEIARKATTFWLNGLGCETEGASTGEEALKLLQKNLYTVILTDVVLDDTDGLQLTKRIRNQKTPNSNIPIIALSACVEKETQKACIEAGMNDFIPKLELFEVGYKILSKYISGLISVGSHA